MSALLGHEPWTLSATRASSKPRMFSKRRAGAFSPSSLTARPAAPRSGSGATSFLILNSWPLSPRTAMKSRKLSKVMITLSPLVETAAQTGLISTGMLKNACSVLLRRRTGVPARRISATRGKSASSRVSASSLAERGFSEGTGCQSDRYANFAFVEPEREYAPAPFGLSLLKIYHGPDTAGDSGGLVVPLRPWWRFSLPLFRSSPSVFAAAPHSNSSLSLLSISWPFCADSAPVDLSFHLWIGCYGCCSIGSGPRSSTQWWWLGPQPSSSGIAGASGSIGAGDHAVRDGPGSTQKSVI